MSPATDDYSVTPAQRLAKKEVDIALCPSESILSHRTSSHPAPLKAIATLLQKDGSAIAALSSSGIRRPCDLDGKRYASYGARYEEATIRQMIINDGGKGDIEVVKPPKLGIPETVMKGAADATWIFSAWEGVEARLKGIDLNEFRLEDFGVPYGYSPVVAVHEDTIRERADVLRKFLSATRRGADDAIGDPVAAAKLVQRYVPKGTTDRMVEESQEYLVKGAYYGEPGEWGSMERTKWENWVDWLEAKGCLSNRPGDQVQVKAEDLWTSISVVN